MKIKEDKKEIIREAAITVIAREGFYNTRMSRIAEEAGIAVGTIYNYFQSKEDVLEYIFKIELEKRLKLLDGLDEVERDFFGRLEYFLENHFYEIKKNLDTGKILVREKDFSRRMNSTSINGYLNQIPLMLEKMLNQAVERREIADCNPRAISAIIFGAIQGIVERALANDELELLEVAAAEIIAMLKTGL